MEDNKDKINNLLKKFNNWNKSYTEQNHVTDPGY